MIACTLLRTEQLPDGVFGLLTVMDGTQVLGALRTVEDDWEDNARGRSCIPAGDYRLHRSVFYKHGIEAFEVTGVPGRSRILLHVANTEEDVEGCIGLGLRRGTVMVAKDEDTGKPLVLKQAVVASREAFRRFMAWLEHTDEATLSVRWAPGLPKPAGEVGPVPTVTAA